ncbi:hypothetical protein ACN38_g7181 [Penicillium nordicum]|uniref:Uncharacterized protein n=1 Tax=Penicillium nordicum TaxID=229535 RepID=A0A0M8P5X8_9EURO|nr:hypothetical protein ACN38_g7181 [Penicillium nordicum]
MGVEKISVRTCPYKCALPSSLSPLRIHTDRGYQSRRQRLGSQLVGLNIGYLPPICRGTPLDQETTPMSSSILPWRVESTSATPTASFQLFLREREGARVVS